MNSYKIIDLGLVTVRELAQFTGQAVACFPGVKFGPLWYRSRETFCLGVLMCNALLQVFEHGVCV